MAGLADLMRDSELAKGLDTPSGNPFGQWVQGVAQRTMHPLETLAKASQDIMKDPTAAALDWSNPMGASLSGLAGIFAGKGAKTADVAKLALAEKLKAQGMPDEKIWKETGWTFGFPDQKPRFEIPDDAAKLRVAPEESNLYLTQQALKHEQLYGKKSAYPELGKTELLFKKGGSGAYGDNLLAVGIDEPKSIALHELQHAIQQREGFARGGSPADFARPLSQPEGYLRDLQEKYKSALNSWDPQDRQSADAIKAEIDNYLSSENVKNQIANPYENYQRLAGEAEARLTQARMAMTPEQRLANYPVSMFDVPVDQQIVRYK